MDYYRVNDMLNEIFDAFNRAPLKNKDRLERLSERLKDLPDAAYDYIVRHFECLSAFPSNLLLEIQKAYSLYESNRANRKVYPLHKCNDCNSTGYLVSLEIIPKPEWGIKSVAPKLRPVTWTCPFCQNWETGPWEIEKRCDPPDAQTLDRCIPGNEDFDAEYESIVSKVFDNIHRKAA